MRWELVLGVLPFLILLICPLHMWWMMRHSSPGASCGKKRSAEGERPETDAAPAERTDREIRLLKERIAQLEMERGDAKQVWE